MSLDFPLLRADQIEVRPTDTKRQGRCTLLLYIDSRCAANILNDTVGVFNWQMEYKSLGDKIYGRLSIWDADRQCWIAKEDTGSESNIDPGKGLSSDILKRCLARWGCDYLYTSPRIVIQCPDSYYYEGKMTMTFSVTDIGYTNKRISYLRIVDRFDKEVFTFGKQPKGKSTLSVVHLQDAKTAAPFIAWAKRQRDTLGDRFSLANLLNEHYIVDKNTIEYFETLLKNE